VSDVALRGVLNRRALATSCALVVLACGCTRGSVKAEPNPTTTTATAPGSSSSAPVSSSTSSSTTTTSVLARSALESLILEVVPSLYEREPDSLANTGPTDLDKAASDDVFSRDARGALVRAGFVRGYQRQWSSNDTVGQNFIFVYQFATPAGARSYLSHWRTAVIADVSGNPPVPFTPPIPGAIGLASRSDRASSGIVLYAKGVYAVQAVATGGPGLNPRAPASSLAFAQYALLP
jgi:hypothetical protein